MTKNDRSQTRENTVAKTAGAILLFLSYGLLVADAVVFCIGWFQPSFLFAIAIWVAICLIPFIVLGHFLSSIGRRSRPRTSLASSPTEDTPQPTPISRTSEMELAGILLAVNGGLLLSHFIPLVRSYENLTSIPPLVGLYVGLAAFGVLVGLLLRRRPATWLKVSAAVISFLAFFNFPLGPVLGCITLYQLAKGWQASKNI